MGWKIRSKIKKRENMKKLIIVVSVLGVSLIRPAFAQTYLSGIVEMSSTTTGQPSGGSRWNTHGGETVVNIFVSSGAGLANPFINGPSDANTSISIPLSLGANTFTLFAGSGGVLPNHAISLFFNGSNSTSSISAVAPTRTSVGTIPAFTATSSTSVFGVDGFSVVPSANTLSYLDGNRLITLTDYFWAAPAVFGVDRISAPFGDPGHVGADGAISDWVGQITLTVTEVPEPGVAALLILGMVGLGRQSK